MHGWEIVNVKLQVILTTYSPRKRRCVGSERCFFFFVFFLFFFSRLLFPPQSELVTRSCACVVTHGVVVRPFR